MSLLTGITRQAFAAGAPLPVTALGDRIAVISGAPGNVVALTAGDGVLLVDSGAAGMSDAITAALQGRRVNTLFNTHYHTDQTGGNTAFGRSGATIHAHEITRAWLATDYYVSTEDRWESALPKAGQPTETFRLKGELKAGGETVEYGYLLEAHTRGDSYVFFRDANVLVAGDVVSPQRDPALDWYAGGWIGGRVDAMDDLLELANDQTRIVPAYGPVMTRTQLQAERDMMQHLWERTTALTDAGRSAQDMLDEGVMNEIDRRFDDPYRFLYDVAKGLWAHYTNFGGNIV
ncbi:MAG: MBL fold metallo-hydrolase [Gammaproteobacteria bacterium]|nr:MBL fold metallo-hydrolase [Gammaproteobacteria bacterium]